MTLKGYRTLIVNAVLAIPLLFNQALPHVVALLSVPEVQGVIPPAWLPWYGVVVAAANVWMRIITNTPVGRAGP